jgi:putative RecB family exonuclease
MRLIEAARAYAASVEWQAVPVAEYIVREFKLNPASSPIVRICTFIAAWREKAITEKGTLEEFIEYIDYFRDAGGKLELTPEPTEDVEDPVQLMTAHAAKGREFDRVFVLRANPPSFPASFRETIFEFPQALREMPSPADSKLLHNQEERRLFYVALTRAKDFLSVYARPSPSRQKPPSGLLRDMMSSSETTGAWIQRDARTGSVGRIEAAAAAQSGVASWMLGLPKAIEGDTALSATAIETYDTCPLKFKLSREWRLPGPVSAALLYGNVMHMVLRDFHDGETAGHPRDEAWVLQLFQQLMADARFDDPIQARLYREQGARQLNEYLLLRNQGPNLPVLHAEQNFEVKISGVRVRGRMDRVDDDGGRPRIVDFKTGRAYDQDKADDSIQLGIYALAARALWGATPQQLVIYNLEDNSEVVSTRDSGQLAQVESKVREIADGIRQSLAGGVFEPRPGFHCRWCDFRNVCPATEQRLYSITRATVTN